MQFGEAQSGSVTIVKYDASAKTVTVKIDNVKFTDYRGVSATVNGTMTSPLNGAEKPAKL